jgi:hypothetical protein
LVGNARDDGREAVLAEAVLAPVRIDQDKVTGRNGAIQNVAKRAKHRTNAR